MDPVHLRKRSHNNHTDTALVLDLSSSSAVGLGFEVFLSFLLQLLPSALGDFFCSLAFFTLLASSVSTFFSFSFFKILLCAQVVFFSSIALSLHFQLVQLAFCMERLWKLQHLATLFYDRTAAELDMKQSMIEWLRVSQLCGQLLEFELLMMNTAPGVVQLVVSLTLQQPQIAAPPVSTTEQAPIYQAMPTQIRQLMTVPLAPKTDSTPM